ncbi:hypothetical protein B0O80DRAFT_309971, partial [Mortierella sp. GBAus27b]
MSLDHTDLDALSVDLIDRLLATDDMAESGALLSSESGSRTDTIMAASYDLGEIMTSVRTDIIVERIRIEALLSAIRIRKAFGLEVPPELHVPGRRTLMTKAKSLRAAVKELDGHRNRLSSLHGFVVAEATKARARKRNPEKAGSVYRGFQRRLQEVRDRLESSTAGSVSNSPEPDAGPSGSSVQVVDDEDEDHLYDPASSPEVGGTPYPEVIQDSAVVVDLPHADPPHGGLETGPSVSPPVTPPGVLGSCDRTVPPLDVSVVAEAPVIGQSSPSDVIQDPEGLLSDEELSRRR